MRQLDYNETRADFEASSAGLNLDFEMENGGYTSMKTICAWIGWCIRIQFERDAKNEKNT